MQRLKELAGEAGGWLVFIGIIGLLALLGWLFGTSHGGGDGQPVNWCQTAQGLEPC